jgi:preprotein translocase subunit SecF
MSLISDVYGNRNDLNFVRTWRPFGIVSIVLVAIAIGSLIFQGLHLSIDFEGGSLWEVPSSSITISKAEDVLAQFGDTAAEQFQEATTSDGVRVLRVSGRVNTIEESQKVADALAKAAGIDSTAVAVTTVGPSWGKDITRTARNSLIIFMVLVASYIAWRLEPKMAIAALVAVIHDILLTVGFYSLFQIEVSPATVIAFLTILGFSLYDTIVVYDRIQENDIRLTRTGQYTYTTVVRRSLNQVLMRSVNTTIVTLIPVLTMLVIGQYVFGEPTLGDFSLALLIGLASGAYSSVCVAAPLTAVLKEREPKFIEIRERLVAKGVDVSDTSWKHSHDPVVATSGVAAASRSTTQAPALTTTLGGHPPRPRKKKR